jgi:signal transduction histidine kinase
MTQTTQQILDILDRGREVIATLERQRLDLQQWSVFLAETLRSLWPDAPLCACVFRGPTGCQGTVLDRAGKGQVKWIDNVSGGKPGLPRSAGLSNYAMIVEEISSSDNQAILLAMAAAKDTTSEANRAARALLRTFGRQTALMLEAAQGSSERHRDNEELASEAALADLGELTSPVTHEFNNFLNTLSLQLAILQRELPKDSAHHLAPVRTQMTNICAVIKRLQQSRWLPRTTSRPVDLHRVLTEVLAEVRRASPKTAFHWTPPPNLPHVRATAPDLKRLFTFLVKNAVAATSSSGTVTIRTEPAKNLVRCAISDTGPKISSEALAKLFEPSSIVRENTNPLELAACKKIANRLDAKIRCENDEPTGITITVDLPTAGNPATA